MVGQQVNTLIGRACLSICLNLVLALGSRQPPSLLVDVPIVKTHSAIPTRWNSLTSPYCFQRRAFLLIFAGLA